MIGVMRVVGRGGVGDGGRAVCTAWGCDDSGVVTSRDARYHRYTGVPRYLGVPLQYKP